MRNENDGTRIERSNDGEGMDFGNLEERKKEEEKMSKSVNMSN